MKMRAKDSFHTSGIGSVHAKQEFEVHDALGKELEARGLAVSLSASTEPAEPKPAPADAPQSETKAELPPLNKSDAPTANKRGRPRKTVSGDPAAPILDDGV